ncbi:TrbI/VirB10 family protein [Piscirickettsia litoralis]|uniref:Conjugal transfer protein TrbI n=1 Tax=Piscirickettsia litoralis TaxID=1891921 RepID=A0ABX3A4S3_9GAMM|nr:TrbI/VirB10 family protein [Piscirickettsia litoralis]ODN43858.1 conjugal transfer protein TrbI [Piscirickettsia litoralis]
MKLKIIKHIKYILSEHPRIRVIIIFSIVMGIIIVTVNKLTKPKETTHLGSSYISSANNGVKEKTTQYRNKIYKKMDKINEDKELKKAESQGKTVIAESTQDIVPSEILLNQQNQRIEELTRSKVFKKIVQRDSSQKNYQSVEKAKLQKEKEYQNKVYKKTSQMQSEIQTMLIGWNHVSIQKGEVGKAVKINSSIDSRQFGKEDSAAVIEKAGTILFAVLDTQLNSDQPGTPVMATIVQGKFKNGKLLGSFKREGEKLVISFDRMSLSQINHSISIRAYAINATTAQNALASDVDHHYLLRYGGLFASAFLQGFGEYFSQTSSNLCGGSTTCIITGDQSSTESNQTTKKALYSGLGQVGSTLAGKASSGFNRPPTVTLNQGIGMGILFMSDVKV